MKIVSLLLLFIFIIYLTNPFIVIVKTQSYSNWSSNEPFPWLSYLKQLAIERGAPLGNVKLYVITRHESTIIVKTKQVFLNSPVARELGIVDLVPIYAGPELWEKYIRDAVEAAQRGRGQPIDVAWGGGPTLFNYIDEKGLVQPLDNNTYPEFNAILYEMNKIPGRISGAPTSWRGSDGFIHWIGAAISSFGFIVNYEKLSSYGLEKPLDWFDLSRPGYAKYLPGTQLTGIADPTMSTSHTRIYEIILQTYGWDLGWRVLTLLAANAKIYSGSSDVRDAVIRGDIAIGIAIDFYGYTAMQQNPSCEYIVPEAQTIINADPIAVLKETKYSIHAAAFVAWVLSEYGGQQVWLDSDINRLPANPRVFDTDAGQRRSDIKRAFYIAANTTGIVFNETLASLIERAMQQYFKATFVDVHHDLQMVWASIARAYLNGDIDRNTYNYLVWLLTEPFEFTDPLTGNKTKFTLEYAMVINKEIDKVYQAIISEWKNGALSKYSSVYSEFEEVLGGKKVLEKYPDLEEEISKIVPIKRTTTPTTAQIVSETPGVSSAIFIGLAVAIAVIGVVVFTVYYLKIKGKR